MAYFPMCIDLTEKRCIVVGGGNVAAGKVRQLLEFGAAVTVAAPGLTKELMEQTQAGRITWLQRSVDRENPGAVLQQECEPATVGNEEPPSKPQQRAGMRERAGSAGLRPAASEDGNDIMIVVAATDDPAVNRAVSVWCKKRRIPVNVVDEPVLCTFFFPGIAKDGEVVVSVSTGGTSPALSARLRRRLSEELLFTAPVSARGTAGEEPDDGRGSGPVSCGRAAEVMGQPPCPDLMMSRPVSYGRAAEVMGTWRAYVRQRVSSGAVRKKVFEAMLERVLNEGALTRREVDDMIDKTEGKDCDGRNAAVREENAAGEKNSEAKDAGSGKAAAVKEQSAETKETAAAGEDTAAEADFVPRRIRVGTRGSSLALAQTELFIRRLMSVYPETECETVVIKTTGDRIQNRPLSEFGGKAVFVTEFEDAIRSGVIDCAVHSAKDMPAELSDGLAVVCVLPRADVRDVLVTRAGKKILESENAVIGTGSLRRKTQFLQRYPHAQIRQLRGNITTRVGKLKNGEYDGIILAAAGLQRLGLLADKELEYTYFEVDEMTPAGGQALIAVEGRCCGQEYLNAVTDTKAERELLAERETLRLLGAGCHEAVGVYAHCFAGEMMRIVLMREQEGVIRRCEGTARADEWRALAEQLVRK